MIVKFVTEDLREALKAVKAIFAKGPGVEKNKNKGCLVASKSDGTVMLESANASGLYIQVKLSAEVEEEGRVIIDRDNFSALKLRASETTLTFKDGANVMGFKSGSFDGDFPVSQDFEEIESQRPPKMPKVITFVPCNVIRTGIQRVMFAPNVDENNPSLRLELSFLGERMVVTASDSFRAAVFSTKLEDPSEQGSVVVPASFVEAVVKSMPLDAVVKFGTNDRLIRIQGGSLDVCHPILQTSEGEAIEVVDREALIANLENNPASLEFMMQANTVYEAVSSVASVVPSSLGTDVRMDLTVTEKGKAAVKVDYALGKGKAKFSVENVVITEPLPVCFSSKYMLEFLSLLKDGTASVHVRGIPIIIRSEQYGTTLVMPQLDAEG